MSTGLATTLSDVGREALDLSVMGGSVEQHVYTSALATPVQSRASSRPGTPKTDHDRSQASPVVSKPPRANLSQFSNNNINACMVRKPSKDFKDVPPPASSQRSTSVGSGSNLDTDDGGQSLQTSPSGTGSQVSPISKTHHELPSNDVSSPLSVDCLHEASSESFSADGKKGRLKKHESIS